MEESKFSPYNKYKSHITSSKIKIHHLLYSNDGSLSVPLPFHHYNQALWSPIKNLAYNSGSLEQSAFRHRFFPFICQQVFLSFIYLNFVPILFILFPHFGETCMSVLVYVTPRAFRSHNSNSIISDSLNTNFPALGKLQISFFFFFSFSSSVSIKLIHGVLRGPLSLSEREYSPGWCQLRSSGRNDATSLRKTMAATSQCDL